MRSKLVNSLSHQELQPEKTHKRTSGSTLLRPENCTETMQTWNRISVLCITVCINFIWKMKGFDYDIQDLFLFLYTMNLYWSRFKTSFFLFSCYVPQVIQMIGSVSEPLYYNRHFCGYIVISECYNK